MNRRNIELYGTSYAYERKDCNAQGYLIYTTIFDNTYVSYILMGIDQITHLCIFQVRIKIVIFDYSCHFLFKSPKYSNSHGNPIWLY